MARTGIPTDEGVIDPRDTQTGDSSAESEPTDEDIRETIADRTGAHGIGGSPTDQAGRSGSGTGSGGRRGGGQASRGLGGTGRTSRRSEEDSDDDTPRRSVDLRAIGGDPAGRSREELQRRAARLVNLRAIGGDPVGRRRGRVDVSRPAGGFESIRGGTPRGETGPLPRTEPVSFGPGPKETRRRVIPLFSAGAGPDALDPSEPDVLFGGLKAAEPQLEAATRTLKREEEKLGRFTEGNQAIRDITRFAPRPSDVPATIDLGIDVFQASEVALESQFGALSSGDPDVLFEQTEENLEAGEDIATTATSVGGAAVSFASEEPERATLQAVGLVGGALIGGAAIERGPRIARSTLTRRKADEVVDLEDITSERGARGELPEFETDPDAPTSEAVSEVRRRAADQPEELQRVMDEESILFRSEETPLPSDFVARRGQFELPGLFTSPDLSPLRLSSAAESTLTSIRPRLPRLFDEGEQVTAFPGGRVEAMPASATGARRVFPDEGDPFPDPTTGGARFLTREAETGTAFVRPTESRTTELEAIFPPGSEFTEVGTFAVRAGGREIGIPGTSRSIRLGGRTIPGRAFERVEGPGTPRSLDTGLPEEAVVLDDLPRTRISRGRRGQPVAPTVTGSPAGGTPAGRSFVGDEPLSITSTESVSDLDSGISPAPTDTVSGLSSSLLDDTATAPARTPSATPTSPIRATEPTSAVSGTTPGRPTTTPTGPPSRPPTSPPGPPTSPPTVPPSRPPTSPPGPPTSPPTRQPGGPPTDPGVPIRNDLDIRPSRRKRGRFDLEADFEKEFEDPVTDPETVISGDISDIAGPLGPTSEAVTDADLSPRVVNVDADLSSETARKLSGLGD